MGSIKPVVRVNTIDLANKSLLTVTSSGEIVRGSVI